VIADVRYALFVVGALRKAHGPKTPGFVKAPRAAVGPKAPEFERLYTARLLRLDELRSSAVPDAVGPRIKQPNFLALPGEKRDDAAVVLGNRHHAFLQDHVRNEPPIFLGGVEHREKAQQTKRRGKELGDRRRVLVCRTTQLERHSGLP
jgi:hypothetical protein